VECWECHQAIGTVRMGAGRQLLCTNPQCGQYQLVQFSEVRDQGHITITIPKAELKELAQSLIDSQALLTDYRREATIQPDLHDEDRTAIAKRILKIAEKDKDLTMSTREHTLLKAAYDLLKQCNQAGYVLEAMDIEVEYDGTTCDGYCLLEDLAATLNISKEDYT
jgi:hypothetical protein